MSKIKITEKTNWYYIGEDFENSFEFFVSKIKKDTAIIITDKNTPKMNIHKVKLSELEIQFQKNKLIPKVWKEYDENKC